jgi:hypothetical protein
MKAISASATVENLKALLLSWALISRPATNHT